ncbi:hypothetical protein HLI01_33665 [Rhizobium laguerreae]|uniref:hypothetical protein n=1 Tax=Rhizobium laguerreae TaxID=1076926 RepID=UPI001478A316|nr:hypothetical protein [Rhizobium laguerreae]NNH61657.1 hypothetical protein [Rhizobium laguerreae]
MSETTRERFIRLAEKRVSRAINDIRLIGNLSDRSNYEYDESQVNEIFAVLRREMNACTKRFEAARKPSQAKTFHLKSRSKP